MEMLQKIFWSAMIIVVCVIGLNHGIPIYEYFTAKTNNDNHELSYAKKSFNQGVKIGYITAIINSVNRLDSVGMNCASSEVLVLDSGFVTLLYKEENTLNFRED